MQEFFTPFVFIIIRAFSGIIPPIPGFMLDTVSIAVFGPIFGLLFGEIGVMIGAVASFFIARKFRDSFLAKKLFLEKIHKWEAKIPENKKFWALVLMRLPTTIVFDYLNYAIGLTRISFSKFFFSTFIGSLPSMVLFYFAGGWALGQGIYYFIAFIALIIILWLIFKKR
ncbi:MAG: VTT domain-containing protein [Candidatus Pacebacteria bacterium]|nr:VTT domain-containing protein [Candidatus Paceibacterota bacterium]